MDGERMFRVIVMGGLSLVGTSACSSTTSPTDAADVTPDFPSELPVFVDVPQDFPHEGIDAAPLDTGPADAAVDASSDANTDVIDSGFPAELPVRPDTGNGG